MADDTKMSKEDRDAAAMSDVLDRSLREFTRIQAASRDERRQCIEDRRFVSIAGAQWEGLLSLQFENKPKLEVNKIALALIRIINEYRNNKISVNFIPKDGAPKGTLSDICNGLYRADEQSSCADEAYDNGFEEGASGGIGAWRLRHDYVDEDEDDDDGPQKIYFEPIFDADTCVYFNLDAKRQDKSDAKKCWVLTSHTYDDFVDEWPDYDPATWPKNNETQAFDWTTTAKIYTAEYYEVERTKITIYKFEHKGDGVDPRYIEKEDYDDPDNDISDELKATGFTKTSEKKKTVRKIHKYIMCGNAILEDCGYIAGKNIPIIPNFGKRWFVDNIERAMGHVRLAKDAQRLKNMQLSKLAEISSLSTVEKPIVTPEQMAGHAVMWSEDNIKNNPYLLLNAIIGADGNPMAFGPQAYTKVPQIPPAMAALLQITEEDIKDLLGNQEAGEQLQNNISGIAVELVQNKLDMQTFIYISNMSKAIKRCGEVWLSMAKEIYIEDGRKLPTINEGGERSSVTLNQMGLDDKGMPTQLNSLTEADFEVIATPGPTSASKRAAVVRSLMALLPMIQDPQTLQVIISMIMMNMEGEGVEEVRDYFRKKLVQMGVVDPTKEEAAELQQEQQAAAQQPPSAQDQFLQASAVQAEADAKLKQSATVLNLAKTLQTNADVVKTHAEAAKTASDIHGGKVDQTLKVIEALENKAAQPLPTPQTPLPNQ